MMSRHVSGEVVLAPLFVLRFPLSLPWFLAAAEAVNIRIKGIEEMTEIADKLRWCRHRSGLSQSEVAKRLGIDRGCYLSYEQYGREYYPIEHLRRLAEIFQVSDSQLFDEYHAFLANNPAKQIQAKRAEMGITGKQFAALIGSTIDQLRNWETGRNRVTRENWDKCFRRF